MHLHDLRKLETWKTDRPWLLFFAALSAVLAFIAWFFPLPQPKSGDRVMMNLLASLWQPGLMLMTFIACLYGFKRLGDQLHEVSEAKAAAIEAESKLQAAECPLIYAGKVELLADHADRLALYLQRHFIAPDYDGQGDKVTFGDLRDRHKFTDRFMFHKLLVSSVSISGLDDKFISYELRDGEYVAQIVKDINAHRDNLKRCGAEAIRPYLKALGRE